MTLSAEKLHQMSSSAVDAATCLGYRDGFHHWHGMGTRIAYWQTSRTWLTVGGPEGNPARRAEAAAAFVEEARALNKHVCFGVIETCDWLPPGYTSMAMGEMPLWQPSGWTKFLSSKSSMREQIRRARAKKISTEMIDADPGASYSEALNEQVQAIMRAWYDSRLLPPFGYALKPQTTFAGLPHKLILATRKSKVIAFMRVFPMYEERGWFVENIFRGPDVPNGTVALLVNCLMENAEVHDVNLVTFGLVPLSGKRSPLLQLGYSLLRPAYNFDGLYAFRKKFGPVAWVPVHLAYPAAYGQLRALIALGRALCGKRWPRFVVAYVRLLFGR